MKICGKIMRLCGEFVGEIFAKKSIGFGYRPDTNSNVCGKCTGVLIPTYTWNYPIGSP